MQTTIVYIITLLAAAATVRYLWRKLKILKKDNNRNGCRECPLKNNCGKANSENEECCDKKKP